MLKTKSKLSPELLAVVGNWLGLHKMFWQEMRSPREQIHAENHPRKTENNSIEKLDRYNKLSKEVQIMDYSLEIKQV